MNSWWPCYQIWFISSGQFFSKYNKVCFPKQKLILKNFNQNLHTKKVKWHWISHYCTQMSKRAKYVIQSRDYCLVLFSFLIYCHLSITSSFQLLFSNTYIHICVYTYIQSKINKSLKVYFFHDLKDLNNTLFTAVACAVAELHFMILSYKLFMRGLLLWTLETRLYPVHLCYRFIMIDWSCHRPGNYQVSL